MKKFLALLMVSMFASCTPVFADVGTQREGTIKGEASDLNFTRAAVTGQHIKKIDIGALTQDSASSTSPVVSLTQTATTVAPLAIVCTQGGSSTGSTKATLNSQLYTCSTYTTTAQTKTGSFKVLINNVERWVNVYDNPN